MKVIWTDKRKFYDDSVVTYNIDKIAGQEYVNFLNNRPNKCETDYFILVEDDYKLFERSI